MTLNTRPNGQVKTCSQVMNMTAIKKRRTVDNLLEEGGEYWNLTKDSIREIWNSQFMRDFRMQKIRGEYIPFCETCYQEDAIGVKSKRSAVIDQFYENNKHLVEEAQKNNGFMDTLPVWWEFRFSSLCNQACRMCIPQTSSKIREEFKTFKEELPKNYRAQTTSAINNYVKYGYLGDNDFFKRQIFEHISDIKYIELHGGEPTVDKNLWSVLTEIVQSGHNRHIHIRVHSNIQNLTSNHIQLWNQFKSGWLGVSIDAYVEENEYIRYKSKWSNIEKKLKLTKNLGVHWEHWVTSSVMAYNCCTMDRLLNWFYEYKNTHGLNHLNWRMDPVTNPNLMRVEHIPIYLRKRAVLKLKEFKLKSKEVGFLIRVLESSLVPPKGSFEELLQYTKVLDQKRKQNVCKVFPHLKEVFNYDKIGSNKIQI